MNIQNPYNSVGNYLPSQPFGSVNDKVKKNENVLIEETGLNQYNFAVFFAASQHCL